MTDDLICFAIDYIDMCQNSSSNDSGWLLYGENNWAMQFRKGSFGHNLMRNFRLEILSDPNFFFIKINVAYFILYTVWSIFFLCTFKTIKITIVVMVIVMAKNIDNSIQYRY